MTSQFGRLGSRPRLQMTVARGAVIGACALLAAACGSVAAPSSGASAPHAGAPGSGSTRTASSAKVSLDVTFSADYGHSAKHWTLRCEPAGGNFPDPAGACARLKKSGNIFAPAASHVMCPMIMTRAQRATVTGTYFGKRISETIVAGGCQLGRYYQLKQVFS